jgi:hypothetical protein
VVLDTLALSERTTTHSLRYFCYANRIWTEYHTRTFSTKALIRAFVLKELVWVCFFVCVGSLCPEMTHYWECTVFWIQSMIFSESHTLLDVWSHWHAVATNRSANRYTPIHFNVALQIAQWRRADACSDRWSKRPDKQLHCITFNLRANIKAKGETKT